MSLDSLFKPEKPKVIDEGKEEAELRRQREALAQRANVDQRTTIAGNKETVGTQTFRSVLGR